VLFEKNINFFACIFLFFKKKLKSENQNYFIFYFFVDLKIKKIIIFKKNKKRQKP
jgi:hypothetical protein